MRSHTKRITDYERLLETLCTKRNKGSTEHNYHQIWIQFNKFLIKLNRMPNTWEDRLIIYFTSLVQVGQASQTISSYISTIKAVLNKECSLIGKSMQN